jgi:hypothetical protein
MRGVRREPSAAPWNSEPAYVRLGSTRSFGDLGSMSGLPESGHDGAIYEHTPLTTQHAQIAERKYCRPHARPFRLRFPRKVPVLPICPPAAL